MTSAGETARNNGMKFCTKRFICISISRFISLIISTSVALNILRLYQLFHGFENLMSPFRRFQFWVPTRFPEAICPRHGPVQVTSKYYYKLRQLYYISRQKPIKHYGKKLLQITAPNCGRKSLQIVTPLLQTTTKLLQITASLLQIMTIMAIITDYITATRLEPTTT